MQQEKRSAIAPANGPMKLIGTSINLRTAWRANILARATFLFAALLLAATPSASAQSLRLENARLIIGDGSVREQASISIENGLIVAIDGAAAGPGVATIDLAGKTVIPALIDGHAHLGYQGRDAWGAENYSRENLIDNLQRYAYYGFGAVFSAGSDPLPLMQALAADIESGDILAARPLFAAGMAPPGQGPNDQFLAQALSIERRTGMTILHGLRDPAQARETVRAVAARGARYVKIWVDDRGGSQVKLAPEIYRAVASEARAQGLKVFVHQQYASDIPPLLDAGVNGFLHGRLGPDFDRELALRTARAGAFIVPNLGLGELRVEAIGEDPFLRATLSSVALQAISSDGNTRVRNPVRDPAIEAALKASLAGLLDEGTDIMLGTDAGALPNHPYGYSGHRELEIYVRLGMTPMQALQTGTSVAARHLGLADMGMLAPGHRADLVVLSANPLDDIRNTRSIEAVYLRGRALDRAALSSGWTGSALTARPADLSDAPVKR